MNRGFPPTPRGYYALAFSDEIAAGQSLTVTAFDREFVAFRGASGNVSVVDAYCAHLGAHLGHGGKVVGDCLECPFHRWQWSGDGRCASVPYAARVPPRARIGALATTERDGMVFVAHGDVTERPLDVPHAPFLDDPDVRVLWRRTYTIASHVQDMAENTVDTAHFPALHDTATPEIETAFDGAELRVGFFADPVVRGRKIPGFPAARIDITVAGLAHVCVETRYAGLPDAAVLQYAIPTRGDLVTVRHVYVARVGRGARAAARRALAGLGIVASILEARRDLPIWQHKIYRTRPVLAESDGPIGAFREWASQFYDDGETSEPGRATV